MFKTITTITFPNKPDAIGYAVMFGFQRALREHNLDYTLSYDGVTVTCDVETPCVEEATAVYYETLDKVFHKVGA